MARNDEIMDAIDGLGQDLAGVASTLDEIKDELAKDELETVGIELIDEVRELRDDLERLSDIVITLSERLEFVGDALGEVVKLIRPQYKPFVSGVTKAGARALIRGLKFRPTPVSREAIEEIVRTWMPSVSRAWVREEIEKARAPSGRATRGRRSEV